jgi:hypothetical protein
MAACSGEDVIVVVNSVSPDHGPLPGGNIVEVFGSGFVRGFAPPNGVLVDGRAALSVTVVDDTKVQVQMPPGIEPGPVDLVVYNNNGFANLSGVYEYNPAPTVTSVSPAKVDYKGGDTITLTGTGFRDLDAGTNLVFVGGAAATDVQVVSDSQLTASAPPGVILTTNDIEVTNNNGSASLQQALRFNGNGLFGLFQDNESQNSPYFIDLDTLSAISFNPVNDGSRATSGTITADGKLLFYERFSNAVTEFDLSTSTESPMSSVTGDSRVGGMAFLKGTIYLYKHHTAQLGTLDVETGEFTAFSTNPDLTFSCCFGGRSRLTTDGTNLILIIRSGGQNVLFVLSPVDGQTISGPVVIPLSQVQAAVVLGGVLFAASNVLAGGPSGGQLARIDLATGTPEFVTLLPASPNILVPAK